MQRSSKINVEKWNAKYSSSEYVYGEEPNYFLKSKLQGFTPEKILFAAEGEGRNAVFAAKAGWETSAFDISVEGKNKAQLLAKKCNVSIEYQIGELPKLDYKEEEFNVIALIFAHFPAEIKSDYHKYLDKLLCKNGIIIFEAFSKNHIKYKTLNPKIGGPNDVDTLYSIKEIKSYFKDYEILELEEKEIELSEGLYHNGKGSVVRFVGKKLPPTMYMQ